MTRDFLNRGTSSDWDRPQLVFISDPGQDLDDEMTYIMLRHLVEEGMVDVLGIIATLTPAFDRARLCMGTLASLGLHGVPIGLGTDGGDVAGVHKASTFEFWAKPYMPPRHSSVFEPGRRLMYRLYVEAEPKSLTLVIIASLKDPALFLRDDENLFESKTREVIIMGGVEPFEEDSTECILKPDTAHNQMFDKAASEFFYRRCQELGVPLVVVSRWAAYAAKVPRSCYDELAALGSWVGCRLRNAQRASIESLWNRACASGNEREGLPDRCDRAWFLKTFCGGDAAPGRSRGDTIWDLLVGFMQYDTVATLAAVPRLRQRFFSPVTVNGQRATKHLVIGCSEQKPNVCDAAALGEFLKTGFVNGISLNNQRRVQFILVSQPLWHNRGDELLACVVLRTLFELGILDCVGIVISPGPTDDDYLEDSIEEQADEMIAMLKSLGLAHVPVHVAQTYTSEIGKISGADLLTELYKKVSPAGISLVLTGGLGAAADFADDHPTEFQQKTQQIILGRGGAFLRSDQSGANTFLYPDESAHNNKCDMPAAIRFHKKAQELLVPLVIISRHCAGAVQIPRLLFDTLAKEGGGIGQKLKEVQQSCTMKLWTAAATGPDAPFGRRGLPPRCNQEWFIDTFCGGVQPDTNDSSVIFEACTSFNVYSLLTVLVALPPFLNKYINAKPITVRSVKHLIIGSSKDDHGLNDLDGIRELVYECLFSGCRLNDSKFDDSSPTIRLSKGGEWKWTKPREALDWMLPGRTEAGRNDFWSSM